MGKILDTRGTTSPFFQVGSDSAIKGTDEGLEVVSSKYPTSRKDFRANTASFEGLVLPNALLNVTDNRFTKNPISNGYELVYGDKRITITVDQETGEVEIIKTENPTELGDLKASTATFDTLNLPKATFNSTKNEFTLNPTSAGYDLKDGDNSATLSIDTETGAVLSSSGLKTGTATFETLNLPNAVLDATDNKFTKDPVSAGYVLSASGKTATLSIDQDTGAVESSTGFKADTAVFDSLTLPKAKFDSTQNSFTLNPTSVGYDLTNGSKTGTLSMNAISGNIESSVGFKAGTATFDTLNLPKATFNSTKNEFTLNPTSAGYDLKDGDNSATLSIDTETGAVEASTGFGIKTTGYVSNAILGFKSPATLSGMTITMPAGYNINYSDGRDLYNETSNPTGKGSLKSYNSVTTAAYTVTVTTVTSEETVPYYVLYDDTVKELFYVSKSALYYGNKIPSASSGYTVRRDANGNEYYRLVDGAWVKRHLMRIASFDLVNGTTISEFEACYPCDLLKLTDYLVADAGGGGGSSEQMVIRSMEIPAATTETTEIALDYACNDKNAMLVMVEHTVVPPSTYDISSTGRTLTFTTAVPAGYRIDLRWFSDVEVIKVDIPLASDTEFLQGTSEVLAPTVKQVHQYNGTKLPLFYPARFPWVANNIEWLRSDTFSWQSGDVYSAAYAELVSIYNADGGSTETETISGYTVSYKRCSNGMKVADSSQQESIINIFTATGSAFYFILDTANTRFKLPRTKKPLIGYEDGLGNYISQEASSGSGVKVAGNQSYLYFYMGTYNQSAIDNTAGLNEELFNTKVDTDLANCTRPYITESYKNGAVWYRIWSDGWVEQGFSDSTVAQHNVTLPVPMTTTNYTVITGQSGSGASGSVGRSTWFTKTTTYVTIASVTPTDYMVCGY